MDVSAFGSTDILSRFDRVGGMKTKIGPFELVTSRTGVLLYVRHDFGIDLAG
jgi:hypothetical protein